MNGYVIECCINVEDLDYNFWFYLGCISGYLLLGGFGVRMDFYVYIDYEILFYYDFLIGKLIVWGYDCFIVI